MYFPRYSRFGFPVVLINSFSHDKRRTNGFCINAEQIGGHRVCALRGTVTTRASGYLAEFTFRVKRRRSASHHKLFDRQSQQAVQVTPTTSDSPGNHKP